MAQEKSDALTVDSFNYALESPEQEWQGLNLVHLVRLLNTLQVTLDSNESADQTLLNQLILYIKYPFPSTYFLSISNWVKQVAFALSNSTLLESEQKLKLAQELALRVGITPTLAQITSLRKEEQQSVTEYFNKELDQFFFDPPYSNLEEVTALIKSTHNKVKLHELAYRWIGRHDLRVDNLKKIQELYSQLIAFDINEPDKISIIQETMVDLMDEALKRYEMNGFLEELTFPTSFVKHMLAPSEEVYGEEDTEIEISHGGGFFYLINFFKGEVNGYKLEDFSSNKRSGLGIQVTTVNTVDKDAFYANRVSPLFLDYPCTLKAKISKNKLQKAPNGYEAGLRTENRYFLQDIQLTNLITGWTIQASDYADLIQQLDVLEISKLPLVARPSGSLSKGSPSEVSEELDSTNKAVIVDHPAGPDPEFNGLRDTHLPNNDLSKAHPNQACRFDWGEHTIDSAFPDYLASDPVFDDIDDSYLLNYDVSKALPNQARGLDLNMHILDIAIKVLGVAAVALGVVLMCVASLGSAAFIAGAVIAGLGASAFVGNFFYNPSREQEDLSSSRANPGVRPTNSVSPTYP